MISADDVSATAKKNTMLWNKGNNRISMAQRNMQSRHNSRQDHARCNKVGERWIHGAVDGLTELNGHIAQLGIVAALSEQTHGEVTIGQLNVTIEHNADLLIGHIQPDLNLRLLDRLVVRVASQGRTRSEGIRKVLRYIDCAPSIATSHCRLGVLDVRIVCLDHARIQMIQIATTQVGKVAAILPEASVLQ